MQTAEGDKSRIRDKGNVEPCIFAWMLWCKCLSGKTWRLTDESTTNFNEFRETNEGKWWNRPRLCDVNTVTLKKPIRNIRVAICMFLTIVKNMKPLYLESKFAIGNTGTQRVKYRFKVLLRNVEFKLYLTKVAKAINVLHNNKTTI